VKPRAALLAALAACCLGCRATFRPVDVVVVRQPPRAGRLRAIERLAVVGFKETGRPGLDSFLAAEVERRLQGRFALVDRTHVRGILEEQDLWNAVFTDPQSQRRAGQILGASHLLVGTVVKYECTDEESVVDLPVTVSDGYDTTLVWSIPRERVTVVRARRVERTAEVKLAMRVVDAATTEQLVAATGTGVERPAPSTDGRPPLPARQDLLASAAEAALSDLLGALVPVRIRATMLMAGGGELARGVDLLRAGDLEAALAAFRAEVAGPRAAEAWYNVGAVLELQGRYGEAAEAYARALRERPAEQTFQKAAARVKGR
jgi:hypothetical protein